MYLSPFSSPLFPPIPFFLPLFPSGNRVQGRSAPHAGRLNYCTTKHGRHGRGTRGNGCRIYVSDKNCLEVNSAYGTADSSCDGIGSGGGGAVVGGAAGGASFAGGFKGRGA